MAFTFVQTKDNAQLTTSTTNVVTPTNPLTAGNLVIINIRLSTVGITVNSVTDSKGNTYALATTASSLGGAALNQYQYYGVQITGGATSVTVTLSSSATSRVIVDEFSGNASTNASVFDKATSTTSSAGSATSATLSPPLTPTNSGELIAVGLMLNNNITSLTAGTNYVIANSNELNFGTEYRLSSTTSETAPISWTTSVPWTEVAGAYIPSTLVTTTSTSSSTSTTNSTSSTSSSTSQSTTSQSTSTSFSSSSTSTSLSVSSISSSTSFSTTQSFTTSISSTSTSSTSTSLSTTTTLIDNTQPVGLIHAQVLNGGPIGVQTTLVDDPVALVDDPKALVGSQTTPISVLITSASSNAPKGFICARR